MITKNYCYNLHGSSARIRLTSSSIMWLSISILLKWHLHALQDWAPVAGMATTVIIIASKYIRGSIIFLRLIPIAILYSSDNHFIPGCCCIIYNNNLMCHCSFDSAPIFNCVYHTNLPSLILIVAVFGIIIKYYLSPWKSFNNNNSELCM